MRERVRVYVCRFADRRYLQLQYADPDTGHVKTKSAKTEDAKEAQGAARDLEYQLNHGLYSEPSRMAWEIFREQFLEEHILANGLREKSRLKYESVLDSYEAAMRPDRLSDVTDRAITRYVTRLRERGAKPATIQGHLVHLKKALGWAVGRKLLPERPLMPKVSVPYKLPKKLSDEDFDKLLKQAADDLWRAFLLTARAAGAAAQRRPGVRLGCSIRPGVEAGIQVG